MFSLCNDVTMANQATEQCCPMVLFIMLYKVVQIF